MPGLIPSTPGLLPGRKGLLPARGCGETTLTDCAEADTYLQSLTGDVEVVLSGAGSCNGTYILSLGGSGSGDCIVTPLCWSSTIGCGTLRFEIQCLGTNIGYTVSSTSGCDCTSGGSVLRALPLTTAEITATGSGGASGYNWSFEFI